MELSGSKAETRTGSKQSKQKKKKVLKKESETERQRQGEPLPLLPGQDSWITTGHCPGQPHRHTSRTQNQAMHTEIMGAL